MKPRYLMPRLLAAGAFDQGVSDDGWVSSFLIQYGYLAGAETIETAPYTYSPGERTVHPDSLVEALKAYQIYHHLSRQDGVLDEETKQNMKLPRCGNHDKMVQPCTLPGLDIIYFIKTPPAGLGQSAVQGRLEEGLGDWQAELAGITFAPAASETDANVIFEWVDASLFGYNAIADMVGLLEPDCGAKSTRLIRFKNSEAWTSMDLEPNHFSILAAALHELGHALGLGHSPDLSAVMFPQIYSDRQRLTSWDGTALQDRYGSP